MHLLANLTQPAVVGTIGLLVALGWMLLDKSDRTRPLLVYALGLNLCICVLLTFLMNRDGAPFPWKFDYVLYGLDESLGVTAASIALPLQDFWRVPLLVVYELMFPMMIVWPLVTMKRNPRGSVVVAYVAELIAGPVLYAILPACGPVYAFGAQWLHPAQVEAGATRLIGMPNAFPSLHVGTAFMFVLLAPGRVLRGIALAFLAGTALATLSTGEHYVIDLVAGLRSDVLR